MEKSMSAYLKNRANTTERMIMTKQNSTTRMEQRIFEMGLPVTTVSVYLMCTGLADLDEPLTHEKLNLVWSSGQDELLEGLDTLVRYGILERTGNGVSVYRLAPVESWKKT